jgi:hypothetical protein
VDVVVVVKKKMVVKHTHTHTQNPKMAGLVLGLGGAVVVVVKEDDGRRKEESWSGWRGRDHISVLFAMRLRRNYMHHWRRLLRPGRTSKLKIRLNFAGMTRTLPISDLLVI